jgi:hypothetical protein
MIFDDDDADSDDIRFSFCGLAYRAAFVATRIGQTKTNKVN